jgi:hypothetical protein
MLASERLVQLSTALPPLSRHFYLIHNRHKILSSRLEHFLKFCRDWEPSSPTARNVRQVK